MMSAIDAIPQAFRKAALYLDERAPQGGIEQKATDSHSQSSTARLQDLREANRQAANTVIHTAYAMDEMGRQRACTFGSPLRLIDVPLLVHS